jgi:hypothetical protein
LDISLDQLDQLASLIGRQMLSLFENDPKEAARWLLRELGWLGLNDVSEAISELMVEEADDEPITEYVFPGKASRLLECPALRVATPPVRPIEGRCLECVLPLPQRIESGSLR